MTSSKVLNRYQRLEAIRCLEEAEKGGRNDLKLAIADQFYGTWFETYLLNVRRLNESQSEGVSEIDHAANVYAARGEINTSLRMMEYWKSYSLKVRFGSFN